MSKNELTTFLLSCGLTMDKRIGKGSHISWKNKDGKIITNNHDGDVWLKVKVKEMLVAGVPIDVIANACKRNNIEFRILT